MPDLIERRHRQTRTEIAEAAIALFTSNGFDAVTMDDVAAAAGTSRRTVYRHFASKDDLVFDHPQSWVALFDEVTADGPDDEAPIERCLRGLRAVADRIDGTADAVLAAYGVYLENPSLRGSHRRIDDEWFTRFATLLAAADRRRVEPENRSVEVAVVAGVLVGTINGLLVAWAQEWPGRSIAELTEYAFARLGPVLTPGTT